MIRSRTPANSRHRRSDDATCRLSCQSTEMPPRRGSLWLAQNGGAVGKVSMGWSSSHSNFQEHRVFFLTSMNKLPYEMTTLLFKRIPIEIVPTNTRQEYSHEKQSSCFLLRPDCFLHYCVYRPECRSWSSR